MTKPTSLYVYSSEIGILVNFEKIVCLMCTHTIFSKNIFWYHRNIFGALYACAHAARDFFYSLKKFFFSKFWKIAKISSNFRIFFFSKFHILCLLYVNHAKFFCHVYIGLKYLKINFREICITKWDYILKFWKKSKNCQFWENMIF